MSNTNGRLISADSHVMEPVDLWEKALFDKFGDETPRVLDGHLGKEGKFFNTGGQVMEYGGSDRDSQKIGMQAAGWDPVVRVEFQEKAQVAAEVLNATFMLLIMRHPNYDCLRACARVFNDWLAEFISHDRNRLYGVGMIPMDDVAWAIEELERCAKNGFRCVNIHLYSPPGSQPYRKAAYDPFWARAAEMDIPIQLHIITGRVPIQSTSTHPRSSSYRLRPRSRCSTKLPACWLTSSSSAKSSTVTPTSASCAASLK